METDVILAIVLTCFYGIVIGGSILQSVAEKYCKKNKRDDKRDS